MTQGLAGAGRGTHRSRPSAREWARNGVEIWRALSCARRQGAPFAVVAEALRNSIRLYKHRSDRAAHQDVERVRSALLCKTDFIEEIDYGAGSVTRPTSEADQQHGVLLRNRVSETASFSKGPRWAEVLFYLVRARRPTRVLEMGTCVGISASYIAKALELNGEGHLWTLEGSPSTAALARETFATVGVADRVSSIVGPFHQTLQGCLAANGPFEFVFVDGHHDGRATVGYFEKLISHLGSRAILVFDDISWSAEMAKAWHEISSQEKILGHVSLGGMGVLCCNLQ